MVKKMVPKHDFQLKKHNGGNAFEVLLYLYKQCKHHTKDVIYIYINGFILEKSYMYDKFDNFSTRKCQQLMTH